MAKDGLKGTRVGGELNVGVEEEVVREAALDVGWARGPVLTSGGVVAGPLCEVRDFGVFEIPACGPWQALVVDELLQALIGEGAQVVEFLLHEELSEVLEGRLGVPGGTSSDSDGCASLTATCCFVSVGELKGAFDGYLLRRSGRSAAEVIGVWWLPIEKEVKGVKDSGLAAIVGADENCEIGDFER